MPTPGWMLLKESELHEVAASGAVFARKLDPARNPEVLRAVDAQIDRRRGPATPGTDGGGPGDGHHGKTLGVGT